MQTTTGQRPVRRPGRPYRPPEDRVPPDAPVADLGARTAWLLGVSRLFAAEGAYAHRGRFVAALNDAGVACDDSRVSRWESGVTTASGEVIAAYERLLGLPAYLLRGALDAGRRPSGPAYGTDLADRADHARLDRLLDAARHGDASGLDWLELARRSEALPEVSARTDDWADLCRRLLLEQSRSLAAGYATRRAALARLVAAPVTQRHVVRAIGEVVLDPRVLRRGDAIALLGHVEDARSSALVLRLMDSEDETVRGHAAHTLAAQLADDRFDPGQVERLEATLLRALGTAPENPAMVDATVRLHLHRLTPLPARVRSRSLAHAVSRHEIIDAQTARTLTRLVAGHAHTIVAGHGAEPDGMLAALCRDALFHAHGRRVLAAQMLLAASPYAAALAAGCAWLLHDRNPLVARRAAMLLQWLAADAEADALAAAAEGHGSEAVRRAAAVALGSVPSPPSAAVLEALCRVVGSDAAGIRDAAIYALGMHGLVDAIGDRADEAVAARVGWWRQNGARLSG